jgi:protein-disulfide isomerase
MRVLAFGLMALSACLAATPEVDKGKAMGSPTAPILIEVFASFDCPHCKILHDQTIPLLVRDYVVPGKAYLVNREFPLSGQYHPYAQEAAQYATAAARIGKYEAVAGAIFANQAVWSTNGKVWDSVAAVLSPADQKKVQALSKDPGVIAEVKREYDAGVAAGITGTPAIFVTHGTRRYPVPAAQLEYSLLKSLLDGFLK